MTLKKELMRQAMSAALKLRFSSGCKLSGAICVYDLAQNIGVEVRFVDIPSLEGMYWKTSPATILLGSERPAGRQSFTCAHELGHHVFSHGNKIDEVLKGATSTPYKDLTELIADTFAGYLLMPKTTVCSGFSVRGLDPEACAPVDFYTVAGWLGVGYSSLVHHMQRSLKLITASRASVLLKMSPKAIKRAILGREVSEGLLVVDCHWVGRAIDAQVGDLLLLPPDAASEGSVVAGVEEVRAGRLFAATVPGIGRLSVAKLDWCGFVRVSRRNYVGRSIFRHMEDVADD